MDVTVRGGPAVRSAEEYLARIPRRIAELIGDRAGEVETALAAGDAGALERIADAANALAIEGRRIAPDEVSIAPTPTCAEVLAGQAGEAGRRAAIDDIVAGRVVAQLFFAGAATRFGKVAGGLLFAFDPWEVAEHILATPRGGLPDFAEGMDPARFAAIREAVGAVAADVPPHERLRAPLGSRILIAYRTGVERLARRAGADPGAARRKARLILHIPESEGGRHIADDFAARGSYGLDPARVLFVPQTLFGGWRASGGKVAPIPGSRKFPYGHGYSSMQLVHPGSASALRDGSLRTIPDDPLASILREGRAIIRTHRVNDLTQVSPAILDIDRIAAGRLLLDRGHAVVIELVMNPTGQKGGNWVTTAGGHRFLVEGMNARADGWPEFMEKHRGAPYNAFRNLYDAEKLREILLEHPLPDHLRVRKLGGEGGARIGLYLESVTGDVTQAPRSRAAAFRLDEREEIHDLKELKDLAEGLRSIAAQDRDEDFRRVAAELGFTAG